MKFGSKSFAILMAIIIALSYMTYKYVTDESIFGGVSLDLLSRSDRLALKKNIVVMGVDERDDRAVKFFGRAQQPLYLAVPLRCEHAKAAV